MTVRTWTILITLTLTAGCSSSTGSPSTPQSDETHSRQSALFDHAEEMARRNEELTKRSEALMTRAEAQAARAAAEADRIDAVLTKWEQQQRRFDAVLSRMEARKP
jgi:hypothetical protein